MRPSALFWLPFIPSGAKNSRDIVFVRDKKTGNPRPMPITNKIVLRQWKEMGHIIAELRSRGCWPEFGDDELEIHADIDALEQRTLVRVRSLGELDPRVASGRGRDLDNILANILDGLAKAGAIGNDKQFRRVTAERWPGGIVHG